MSPGWHATPEPVVEVQIRTCSVAPRESGVNAETTRSKLGQLSFQIALFTRLDSFYSMLESSVAPLFSLSSAQHKAQLHQHLIEANSSVWPNISFHVARSSPPPNFFPIESNIYTKTTYKRIICNSIECNICRFLPGETSFNLVSDGFGQNQAGSKACSRYYFFG